MPRAKRVEVNVSFPDPDGPESVKEQLCRELFEEFGAEFTGSGTFFGNEGSIPVRDMSCELPERRAERLKTALLMLGDIKIF
jgi:hypothetical protein